MLLIHKVRCCFPHAFLYHLISGERVVESAICASFLWASADGERWLRTSWLLVSFFCILGTALHETGVQKHWFSCQRKVWRRAMYLFHPAFLSQQQWWQLSCSMTEERSFTVAWTMIASSLANWDLSPRSLKPVAGHLVDSQLWASRMCSRRPAGHPAVTLQLHPVTSVYLVTFRRDRDCVWVHTQQPQRLHIHRQAGRGSDLLSCNSLPQTVASLLI